LSEVVEGLLVKTGSARAEYFMQDYGGPVGFRLLGRHPEWMEWLILQNTNAYEESFTAAWDGIRHALWKNRGPETEAPLLPFLGLDGIKLVYQHRHARPVGSLLRLPHERRPLPGLAAVPARAAAEDVDLLGQRDIFFTPEGGEAYLRDLPQAELHRLDSGHFAVEDSLDVIAPDIRRFHEEKVAPWSAARQTA
jgi:pimeloyl-ACP methyl ester carboxylesterase